MIAKALRVEDPAYLAWCRRQRCAFCPAAATEPHHVGGKGMGGARCRDDQALPVCPGCHRRCHGAVVVVAGDRRLPIARAAQDAAVAIARAAYLAGHDAREAIAW